MVGSRGTITESQAGEIIIALVGPLGTNLDLVIKLIRKEIESFGWRVPKEIHISDSIFNLKGWKDKHVSSDKPTYYDERIKMLQNRGDELCKQMGRSDAMAILGVKELVNRRKQLTNKQDPVVLANNTVYILRSLKRPAEVKFLKELYGSFCLFLAAYTPRESRVKALATKIARSHNSMDDQLCRETAESLITKDESEGKSFGQSIEETFPLADAFVNADEPATLPAQIERFVNILFGDPTQSPTKDEFGMFLAKAAALRSADLARQVGAVVTTADGDIISVGTNEVPKPGGGLYWINDIDDDRDCRRGEDVSLEMRKFAAKELFSLLEKENLINSPCNLEDLLNKYWSQIKGTAIGRVTEFGRTVHAEMAALIDASRRGVSVKGGTLYVTTFPCHNCTRHIIGAGINRVVYLEPYPKSLAESLHRKAIVIDSPNWVKGLVNYQPFVGISPHRYVNLFGYKKDERKSLMADFKKKAVSPRYIESWHSPVYPPVEEYWVKKFVELLKGTKLSFK